MDEFLKYFEDKKFVNWVIKPSKELDEFWHGYIEKNKSETSDVVTFPTLSLMSGQSSISPLLRTKK